MTNGDSVPDIGGLLKSSRFRLLCIDAVVALIALTVGQFLPDYATLIGQYVAILQVPVTALLVGYSYRSAGYPR